MSMVYHQPFIRDQTQIGLPFFVRMGLLGEQGSSALSVSPSSSTVAFGGTLTLTANLPSTWTAIHGSLVTAGDNFSAVYTAPGSGTSDTITVTSIDDPADVVTVPITLSSFGPLTQGSIVPAMAGANRSIITTRIV